MAQIGLWKMPKKKTLEDRGALLKEEGDLVREYKAMQEEHVLDSWLKINEEGRATEEEVMRRRIKEEEVMSGKRKAEEEMGRDSVGSKRACFNSGRSGNSSEGGNAVGVVPSGAVCDGGREGGCRSDGEEDELLSLFLS